MQRTVWALVLSLPLSFVAFGIAGSEKCPELWRWAFSPGYVLAMHLPPVPGVGKGFSDQFSRDIQRFTGIGLLTNIAYYYVIFWASFVGFDLVRRKRRWDVRSRPVSFR